MIAVGQREVRTGLPAYLGRLWRYAILLSGRDDAAEDLVQATCVRALERSHQFVAGSRLDRWLFAILRSIWLNDLRSRRVREGKGVEDAEIALIFDDAEIALSFDGAEQLETHMLAAQILKEVHALPEPQRETLFLVYVEGLTYREAAQMLGVPIGTVMSRLASARVRLGKLGAPTEQKPIHATRRR
jgi:RNA polymerase sigma-70 factor (ECF subfamily)